MPFVKTVFYRLRQIDRDGSFHHSPVVEVRTGAPAAAELLSPHPNPATATTVIGFRLAESGMVSVSIHDALGRAVVRVVDNERFHAGTHAVSFDTSVLPNGTYWCRLSGDDSANRVHRLTIRR